ncbi:two-component sensor histidine kinase [Ahniella affigens]|uniref:histidine kinase n=1 Tax=Ahniella affigens TaxID=2021234 RepID=A0A2P1PQ67_9GAMM|nr:HAMP domain-containing sensor histidine kinase [Ahniella affigens]AVP96972.1 two-component sensor histidine kinase [Ahniella affigens]
MSRESGGGLRSKLWVAFVMQVVAIGLATLFGVYAAMLVLRDVLIKQALVNEAAHYWTLFDKDPGASLPNTYNMHGYARADGGTEVNIPAKLRGLAPGYHSVNQIGGDDLIFVSDHRGHRLWLIFDQEQVNKLALWFGFFPLALVLGAVYVVSFFTYRMSRSAISPIVRLAETVRALDPRQPDLASISPDHLPGNADLEVRTLAESIHSFAARNQEFLARERAFTRDASHELRTPLTVIKIAADIIVSEETLSNYGQRSMAKIRRAVSDMESLIQAFLILAREGDMSLKNEQILVNDIVRDVYERARGMVSQKAVELILDEQAQLVMDAPPAVLSIILTNLLGNACQYTDHGSIRVTVDREGVQIADSGCGMSADVLQRVFDPFFRGGDGSKPGHGVGLTIVRRLSDRFHWPIKLSSEPGVGTTARLCLPDTRLA